MNLGWSVAEDIKFNQDLWDEAEAYWARGLAPPPPDPGEPPAACAAVGPRQRFCRGCAKMYPAQSRKSKGCSEECRARVRQLGRCQPACAEFEEIPVSFRDGTQHVKRVCKRCRRGQYVEMGKPKTQQEKKAIRIKFAKERAKTPWNPTMRFYKCQPWRELRYRVLKNRGAKCEACQSINGPFHVDHILPRSKYPHLELEESNLQVLCADCNIGKGAWDQTDWRTSGNSPITQGLNESV